MDNKVQEKMDSKDEIQKEKKTYEPPNCESHAPLKIMSQWGASVMESPECPSDVCG